MSKLILKSSLFFFILIVFVVLSGMTLNLKSDNKLNQNLAPDSLKTVNNYQVTLLKDETIDVSIDDWDYFHATSSSDYKKGENQSINTNDYNFNFKYSELIKNDNLITPEELNLYDSKSRTKDLKSLMSFSFSKYNLTNGYENMSWWRGYVTFKETWSIWNEEDPNQYIMEKDNDGLRLDDRMMGIFHNLMKNKLAREIIYESFKQNYNHINNQISGFQKRLLLTNINPMIVFCENYSANRKKYLKGKTILTEKPGEDSYEEYGYETSNEGFLFRRIEFDGIPPLELAKFLKEFQKIIVHSLNSSDYNSNMSCEINGGKLKVNSYANSKNTFGFLLRTSNNNGSYFVTSQNIKITKLEIKGKDFWRILYDKEKSLFITLDENLKKV